MSMKALTLGAPPSPFSMKRLATLFVIVLSIAPASRAQVGWCNVQWPPSITHDLTGNQPVDDVVYGQIWKGGVTEAPGPGAGIAMQLGFGAPSTDATTWTWTNMTFNVQVGNNDEFMGTPNPTTAGSYHYLTRASDDGGATWTYCDLSGVSTATGYTNPGVMTISGALPVELVSLTATGSGTTALVRWTTASETNNAAFALEHRLPSGSWDELVTVAGRGTTAERTDYAQPVAGLAAGRHTFRLTQRDLDGTATVVGTVEAAIAPDGAVAISERRVGSALVLGVTPRTAQALRVEAFDVTGRRVATLLDGVVDATAEVTLDRATLAAGVYVVRVSGAGVAAARTVVVR